MKEKVFLHTDARFNSSCSLFPGGWLDDLCEIDIMLPNSEFIESIKGRKNKKEILWVKEQELKLHFTNVKDNLAFLGVTSIIGRKTRTFPQARSMGKEKLWSLVSETKIVEGEIDRETAKKMRGRSVWVGNSLLGSIVYPKNKNPILFAFQLRIGGFREDRARATHVFREQILRLLLRREQIRKKVKEEQIQYGADPELEVEERIGKGRRAQIGCAKNYLVDRCRKKRIGLDGFDGIVELRPLPGTPEKVTDNIRKLVRGLRKIEEEKQIRFMVGGGVKYPLGGHIHFSGVTADTMLIRLLDIYIGIPLKKMKNGVRPVRHTSFGVDGDYRSQEDGTLHWEYRVPPSFICSPSFTRAVFEVTNMVVKYWIKISKEDRRSFIIIETPITFANSCKRLCKDKKDRKFLNKYLNGVTRENMRKKVTDSWLGKKRGR